MEHEDDFKPQFKISAGDLPKVHSKINHNRPHTSPHVSPETTIPSTSGQQKNTNSSMRKNEETTNNDKENHEAAADWIVGGPVGAKGTVLVFRSCVLASKTPPTESTKAEKDTETGTTILLNKAKNMAKRLVTADPNSINIKSKNIMHEVMETFGNNNKYTGQAYIVKHASDSEQETSQKDGQDKSERKRNIEDVLNDLNKITLKSKSTKENSTSGVKPAQEPPPQVKDVKDVYKYKNTKAKPNKKTQRHTAPSVDGADDWENMIIKDVDNIKVLDSSEMPARSLKMSYKLVNTETKLLHRLLQAHGLLESTSDSKEFNLLWSGLHPKPDVLRALLPYQRVNHFPRSYELTRKDKLFKNIEKMQYFRGFKNFDFIPTSFLMPVEYKELCTTHYRTKGPWIVKPAASSRGRGIYIVNSPEQIPKDENVVVAKYIDKPLLIGGHKCDLRLYVCVTSIDPLLIYLYEEGLVRFATVKYDKTNKNLWNPCMHLCNYSINKYHTDYIKCSDATAGNVGHKWTLSALLRHLRAAGRDTAALMAAVEDLVVKSVLAGAHTITAAARVFVPHTFNCFELFGYDILIDDTLKPWLLEINLSPSLACESPLDARVKSALLADTLTLVGLPAVHAAPRHAHAHRTRVPQSRRVHSAEAVCRGPAGTGAGLTSEERRLVRAVRAQYARRGGFVRIFPSQNSWQKYSQYLDPVSGVPVCSTSLSGGAAGGGYAAVQHNHNLLVHAHVLPQFRDAAAAPTDTPERLKRYETVSIAGAAPAVQLSDAPARPEPPRDIRHAKELIKQQLANGLRLTTGEGRRLFGLYLTHVLKRLSRAQDASGAGGEAAAHAALVLRFLRRASGALRTPYRVRAPPPTMCDKDRCAVVASHLNDFLYMYCRETDLYADSDDDAGCVPNIHFAQFLYSASEADLEDVLLTVLRADKYVATFLGDGRSAALSVDLPPARRAQAARPALLRLLAALTHRNCRRYRSDDETSETSTRSDPDESSAQDSESATVDSGSAVKESLMEEKPFKQALKYANS